MLAAGKLMSEQPPMCSIRDGGAQTTCTHRGHSTRTYAQRPDPSRAIHGPSADEGKRMSNTQLVETPRQLQQSRGGPYFFFRSVTTMALVSAYDLGINDRKLRGEEVRD